MCAYTVLQRLHITIDSRTKVAGLLLAGQLPDVTLCKLPPPNSNNVLVAGKSHSWG